MAAELVPQRREQSFRERIGVARGSPDRLVALYGAEAVGIAAGGGDVAAEARHAVLSEGALTLEDYWVRRSARAWFGEDAGLGALKPAAEAMAHLLGWSETEQARQVAACRTIHETSLAALRDGPERFQGAKNAAR